MVKVYAVKKGYKTGVFDEDWDTVKSYIAGFPGAEFRSFKGSTKKEAIDKAKIYLGLAIETVSDNQDNYAEQLSLYKINITDKGKLPVSDCDKDAVLSTECVFSTLNKSSAVAYTDGSYNDKTEIAGVGVVYFSSEKRTPTLLSTSTQSEGMHQILGETEAVLKAVELAIKEKKSLIEIRYDYEGVAKWATGEWKAKTPKTKAYQVKVAELSEKIEIVFRKIDAHSGNALNDMADTCAKNGCGAELSASGTINLYQNDNISGKMLLSEIVCVFQKYGYTEDCNVVKTVLDIIKMSESDIYKKNK